jgi:hypothetical protein
MGFWAVILGLAGGGGVPASPGTVDPVWFGLRGFNWPPVLAGGQVADPGYFTLTGFAMPWAGMGVTVAVVTPTRTGTLEWDADDVSGGLAWGDAAGTLAADYGPAPALAWG